MHEYFFSIWSVIGALHIPVLSIIKIHAHIVHDFPIVEVVVKWGIGKPCLLRAHNF